MALIFFLFLLSSLTFFFFSFSFSFLLLHNQTDSLVIPGCMCACVRVRSTVSERWAVRERPCARVYSDCEHVYVLDYSWLAKRDLSIFFSTTTKNWRNHKTFF